MIVRTYRDAGGRTGTQHRKGRIAESPLWDSKAPMRPGFAAITNKSAHRRAPGTAVFKIIRRNAAAMAGAGDGRGLTPPSRGESCTATSGPDDLALMLVASWFRCVAG
jgi:hypothetical protein